MSLLANSVDEQQAVYIAVFLAITQINNKMSVCQKNLMEMLILMMMVTVSSTQDCNGGTYMLLIMYTLAQSRANKTFGYNMHSKACILNIIAIIISAIIVVTSIIVIVASYEVTQWAP